MDAHRHLIGALVAAAAVCWSSAGILILLTTHALAEPPAEVAPPDRTELSLIPAIVYNSDAGFGFGALGAVAGFEPGYFPYRWRLEAKAFALVRMAHDGAEFGFHDDYIKLDLPGRERGLRLGIKAMFTQTISNWYGLGNAAADTVATPRYYHYSHRYPSLEGSVRFFMGGDLYFSAAASFTYSWIRIRGESRLAADLAGESGEATRSTLIGTGRHGLWAARTAIEWDTRDHEIVPRRGMFHELSVRGGVEGEGDFSFATFGATTRFYASLWREYLVVAARVMSDAVVGRPPIYELPFIGDSLLVRGVPWRRYHGRARVLGNAEVRSQFLPFTAWGQRLNFGAVAFADAGRVFADYQPDEALDGAGAGLKWGVGGGLRLLWGEAFLIRFDGAWSPDGIGLYVGLGHVI